MQPTDDREVNAVVEHADTNGTEIQVGENLDIRAEDFLEPLKIQASQFGSIVNDTAAFELTIAASAVGELKGEIEAHVRGGEGSHGGGKGEDAGGQGELHFEIKECGLLKKQKGQENEFSKRLKE